MKNKQDRFVCLFIFTILSLWTSLSAQVSNDKIDSLKEVIRSGRQDIQTADAMILLAQTYNKAYNPDSALVYAEKALELANRINYPAAIAEGNYIRCLYLTGAGNLKAAIDADRICIDIAGKIGDENKLGKAYYQMGSIMNSQGKTDSAIFYLHKSMVYNTKLKDSIRLIAMANLMGSIFMNLSQYDSAAFYFMKAIKLAESSGNQQFLGKLYGNIGKTFIKLNEITEARKYILASLKINQRNGDKTQVALNFINLGVCYGSDLLCDSALGSLDKAREILRSSDYTIISADLYNEYAWVYEKMRKYDSAMVYYSKALGLYKRIGYPEGIMVALQNKGSVSIKLGKYDQAEKYLDSSLAMAHETGYRINRMNVYDILAENYYESGNYKKAYDYKELEYNLRDSINNLEKTRIINELRQKYEKEQDQAMILRLEKESLQKTIQRNLVFSAGIIILVVAVFGFIYLRQRIIKAKILARQKIRQFEEEKKLMSARMLVEGQEEERKRIAMELHDGLGVLLSATKMQFMALSEGQTGNAVQIQKAAHLLEQASKETRRISHNMMPGLLTKLGFLEAVGDLIDNLNETGSMKAVLDIEGKDSRFPENIEIMLFRIVQELINNTLKYAKANMIELKLNINPSLLVMNYKDDGIGFEVKEAFSSSITSLGLRSIEARVGFLNGQMEIVSSRGNGVSYIFRIPIEETVVS
jgi:two-component system, NarL family, sensor kinase